MIYFTKYAEQKFEILNKHKVYITREQIIEAVNLPDQVKKKESCIKIRKDNLEIICKIEDDIKKVLTFYPI